MTKKEALKLLRGGEDGIREWNLRKKKGEDIPRLSGADLSGCCLYEADLGGAILFRANLNGADLGFAALNNADLDGALLNGANLTCARLENAKLSRADLSLARLTNAKLVGADLSNADLSGADVAGADLSFVLFFRAVIRDTNLSSAKLLHASFGATTFAHVDLSAANGLESSSFHGPCHVSVDTLEKSRGRIPDSFLNGCGFQKWQIIEAKQHAPGLDAERITQIHYDVINARTHGPLFIGGVFISYSRDDAKFVDKIDTRLKAEGAPTWLDRHDLLAGNVQKQIGRAIRVNDVVLLVLSESAVNSDWVEHELEMAREKEKNEGRDVLCPVALDDAWKAKMEDALWRQIKKKNVLDFSKWKTKAFEGQFQKLLTGLKVNFPKRVEAASAEGAT